MNGVSSSFSLYNNVIFLAAASVDATRWPATAAYEPNDDEHAERYAAAVPATIAIAVQLWIASADESNGSEHGPSHDAADESARF